MYSRCYENPIATTALFKSDDNTHDMSREIRYFPSQFFSSSANIVIPACAKKREQITLPRSLLRKRFSECIRRSNCCYHSSTYRTLIHEIATIALLLVDFYDSSAFSYERILYRLPVTLGIPIITLRTRATKKGKANKGSNFFTHSRHIYVDCDAVQLYGACGSFICVRVKFWEGRATIFCRRWR